MKTTRHALMYTVSLAAILALSACGKTDESASQVPATPPPAATAAAPAMAPSSSTQSPAPSGSAMTPMNSGSSAQPPASSGTAGSGH